MKISKKMFLILLSLLVVVSIISCNKKEDRKEKEKLTLLNVSYDPTREFYVEYNKRFLEYWEKRNLMLTWK